MRPAVPARWVTTILLGAATCAAVPAGAEEPLVEPMFVEGVMPPAAPGMTFGMSVPARSAPIATMQLDLPLGPRTGGSVWIAAQPMPGRRELEVAGAGGRVKVLLREPGEAQPGLVLGAAIASPGAGPGQVSASAGAVHLAPPLTLELMAGLSSSTEGYEPGLLLGAAVGAALGSRLRLLLEASAELGRWASDRALYLGPAAGFQLGSSTALYAGCMVGLLAGAEPVQVLVQLKQDL